jgi:Ca2+-transporting ATPase
VLFALALALPVPLLALQLIWLNLITDAIPAMGISVEPFTEDLMTMPPRNPKERIIGKREFKMIFAVSAFITLATSAVYIAFLSHSIEYARTSAFCVLALMEIFFALSCKSLTSHIFKKEFFNNPQLFAALISSIISLLLVIYIPSLQNVFLTVPLALGDLLLFFAAGVSAVLFSEALKILFKNE